MSILLKDICTKITDGSHNPPSGIGFSDYLMISSKNIHDGEIDYNNPRFLTQSDYEKENKRTNIQKGDLLMSIVGTIGRVAVVDNKTKNICLQRSVAVIKPNDKLVNSRFLMYELQGKRHMLEKLAHGVAQKGIYLRQVESLPVDLPSMEIQLKIVTKLDNIARIIMLRNWQLNKLDELVKSRFVELFEDPNIPKVRLGECCIINPKKSSDNRLSNNDLMVSFVSMSDVSENGQVVTRHHKQYKSVKSGFTYFAENDVLFAKITPCMENGKGGIAKGLLNGIGFGSTEFHVLRPISGVTNSYWLYELTSFPQFRKAAEVNMTGSAGQRRVPASFLANYRVSLPPIGLQNQFADFVQQLDKSKLAVQKSLEELETLKKSLMQQYFG
jgi:type I restriction enzyme S subunit